MVREIHLLRGVRVEMVVARELPQEFLPSLLVRESLTPKEKEYRHRQTPRSRLVQGRMELEEEEFRRQVRFPHLR